MGLLEEWTPNSNGASPDAVLCGSAATEFLAIGLSRGQISRRVNNGRLTEVSRSVFLLAGAPPGGAVDLAAACLAVGGVASHRSAAHLQNLVDLGPSRPEVTVGPTHGMRGGAILHRSSDLRPSDIIRVAGIRTTNATRTLVDLGSVVPAAVLEIAVERALYARLTTFDRLVRRFFDVARSGRPGVGKLRTLLVERDPKLAPAESDLETLLLRILRDFGLPAPTRQLEVRVADNLFRLDVAYPELKIFIEGDGFGVHTTRYAFERDRVRQNILVVAGWLPLLFTWRHLCHDPERVASQVTDARNRRLFELS